MGKKTDALLEGLNISISQLNAKIIDLEVSNELLTAQVLELNKNSSILFTYFESISNSMSIEHISYGFFLGAILYFFGLYHNIVLASVRSIYFR